MPDYNFIMDSRLRPEQLRVVNQLGRMAAIQGLNVYLAGGSVRDVILGLTGARHLTFVVEGNIQRILRPLTSRAPHRSESAPPGPNDVNLRVSSLTVDSKLDEAHVVFEGGVRADIAMSRHEAYHVAGKPPELSHGTIFDDLRRRDFSIDAIAISLHPNSRGLLLDPTNGTADIERKELRALHSRSFFDDPSRIYRLLRLSLRFGFKPDEKTARWLDLALEERAWEHLSEDQQGRELRAILGEEQSGKLLKLLKERDLIAGLDRKLASARIEFDKFERIRSAVHTANATDDDAVLLNFLAMVARLPGAEQNRLAKKILKDAKTVKTALGLERDAGQLAKTLGSAKIARASQVYTLLSASPLNQVLFLLIHDSRSTVQNRVKAFLAKYPAIRAALPRAELESLGLPPGPQFEKVMDQIFLDELDGRIRNPQHMTKLLMDYAGIKAPPPAPAAPPAKPAGKAAGQKAAGPKPSGVVQPPAVPAAEAAPTVPHAPKSGAAKPQDRKPQQGRPAATPAKAAKVPPIASTPARAKVSPHRKAGPAPKSPKAASAGKISKGRSQASSRTKAPSRSKPARKSSLQNRTRAGSKKAAKRK